MNKRIGLVIAGVAAVALIGVGTALASTHTPSPPPPPEPPPCGACTPSPRPDPNTGLALFPDGTPAANVQLVFYYEDLVSNSYADLTTDSTGHFQLPDYSSCVDLCELWLYVPGGGANQDAFDQATNYHQNGCDLPLAASAGAQSWNDIQLTTESPATLYVVNTDCDISFYGVGTFNASLSQSQTGNWLSTTGIEQLLNQGQLDESTPYSGVF